MQIDPHCGAMHVELVYLGRSRFVVACCGVYCRFTKLMQGAVSHDGALRVD